EADAEIRTCSTTPTTASNWSPATGGTGYQVGDPGIAITDLATWGRFLVVGKEDGLWTFDEDLKAIPRLPDLAVFRDPQNCVGMTESGGYLYVPHIAGLVRWAPGEYAIVGPNAEGALEGDVTPGWGRVASLVPFGGVLFWVANDPANNVASLGSTTVGLGQRTLATHFVQQFEDEFCESVTVVVN